MRRFLLLVAAVAAVVAHAAPTGTDKSAGRIVCWTENNGQRSCGDRVPPEYAKKERQVLDAYGRVVDVKARELSPEEVAERQRQAAEAAEAARKARERSDYDRFLMQSYSSVSDLKNARDERLATLDGRAALAEQSVRDTERTLASLKERQADEPNNARLAQQVHDFQMTRDDSARAVAALAAERAGVCRQFGRDILRYQQLARVSEIEIGDCPPPGSLRRDDALSAATHPAEERPRKP